MVKGLALAMVALLLTAPAQAQTTQAREPQVGPSQKQVVIFEDILRRAVQNGAVEMWSKVRRVTPDLILSDVPEVNGFRITDSLTFFSVLVPSIRPSLAFQLEMIQRNNEMVRRLQAQGRPAVPVSNSPGQAQQVQTAAPPIAPFIDADLVGDPGAMYTQHVQEQLIGAMLDNSSALQIPSEGFLVVAARDNTPPDPRNPTDRADSQTLTFSIKGSDLKAFQLGTISRDEARKRVMIRED